MSGNNIVVTCKICKKDFFVDGHSFDFADMDIPDVCFDCENDAEKLILQVHGDGVKQFCMYLNQKTNEEKLKIIDKIIKYEND